MEAKALRLWSFHYLLLFAGFLLQICSSEATVVTQPIVTTLTITSTESSTITASFSLSTSTIQSCGNDAHQMNCQTQVTVISVPVTSEVTEFMAATTVSTIGFTTISETLANSEVGPTTHMVVGSMALGCRLTLFYQ